MGTRSAPERKGRTAALLLGVCCIAAAALATVGFPARIRVLGYDPEAGRLYYVLTSPRGEPNLPRVLSVAPAERDGTAPLEHSLWPEGKREEDLPDIYRTIEEFSRTLEPLAPYGGEGWTLQTAIERHDTIQDPYFGQDVERFAMRLRFEAGPYGADTTVTAYIRRTVEVIGFYEMPGCGEAVAHFSFTGDLFEGGYMTDALLVLPRRPASRR